MWNSGNTAANGRQKLMANNVTADSDECWFHDLVREECSSKLTSNKRVDRGDVEALIATAGVAVVTSP